MFSVLLLKGLLAACKKEIVDIFYEPVGFNYLLFTKVDKVKQPGHLLELTYKTGTPVSYVCAGDTIPDDIEAANALTLAYMILKG